MVTFDEMGEKTAKAGIRILAGEDSQNRSGRITRRSRGRVESRNFGAKNTLITFKGKPRMPDFWSYMATLTVSPWMYIKTF
jgi:hypothetical protein